MTAAEFRKIALSLPETVEASHVGHPDFRVRGRIFATLAYPNDSYGVLILTPEEQQKVISSNPSGFSAVNGGWGRRGSTQVLLSAVDEDVLRERMTIAWRRVAPKRLTNP